MVTHKPYLCAMAAVVVILLSALGLWHHGSSASLSKSDEGTVISSDTPLSNPASPLSTQDKELYQAIFTAQRNGDWKTADDAIGKLSNPLLVGYVLAERYLHKDYVSTPSELADWLTIYADHPQAYDIYLLAQHKNAPLKNIEPVRKPQPLQGYGDDHGIATSFAGSAQEIIWRQAIQQWNSGNKHEAAKLFVSLLERDSLTPWQQSATAFWAYRCYNTLGHSAEANKYLRLAAEHPRSFYGILARKKLGHSLELDKSPDAAGNDDIAVHLNDATIQRIIALTEIGRSEFAEQELRIYFPQLDNAGKTQLLHLSYQLRLPSVQIAMAKYLADDQRTLDYARYPIPDWQPQNGFKIDRALLYALVRQESGFHAAAISPSGASGLMQLMPKTASLIKKRMYSGGGEIAALIHNESDPMFNVALGQDYVRHLLEVDAVDSNLFYLLTAYNAGPGRLVEWKRSIDYQNDPLLFVESIPYTETRNYVMQVMANYWIYSELEGSSAPSAAAVLSGQWPDYNQHAVPMAAGLQAILENDAG